MKIKTGLLILLVSSTSTILAEGQKTCDRDAINSELDDFIQSCPAMAQIYDGPYLASELAIAIDQVCSEDEDCGGYPFQCGVEYHTSFCENQEDTAAAITISEVFECFFQEDENSCNQKAYCNFTEVLGAMVCVPLLEEDGLAEVIGNTCSRDPKRVKEVYANLAAAKGEDYDLAATHASFALDFYCGKDENGDNYFPDKCPCEFGEFVKLHTKSSMVADGFGKAPLACAGDATGNRMKRAFSINTAAVAEWKLRLAMQSYHSCQTTSSNVDDCMLEAQTLNKATKYKKSAVATLNGMCVTDPTKTGPEAYCMHRLKVMPVEIKQCLLPLVMGKTETCTSECDTLLAPVIEELTTSCCAATLQEYFSFHGNPDHPFLYSLAACETTSSYISDDILDPNNACPELTYNDSEMKEFCLPMEWSSIESFVDPLSVAMEEEMSRSLGLVPNQVDLELHDTENCQFDSGASAVMVQALVDFDDGTSLEDVDFASIVLHPAVSVVLKDNGCDDCVRDSSIQYTVAEESSGATTLISFWMALLSGLFVSGLMMF